MDIENSALAAASHSRDVSSAEERIQVAELQKQVNKLKNLLRVTWKGAERHPDILGIELSIIYLLIALFESRFFSHSYDIVSNE